MTQRLQVLVSDGEMQELRVAARMAGVSVGEWVRQSIRRSLKEPEAPSREAKRLAVREAIKVYAPTGDIEQMNREIEGGYGSGLP
jgi:hypothetical protein